jgi:acetylornithine deacetylase/succinyl-diaminopimelate desuccinylase-like protein
MAECGGDVVRVPVDAARLLDRYGFTSPTDLTESHAVVGSWGEYRPDGVHVVLNGHIDTVPAGKGWTAGPHDPVLSPDGALYGLGSADMKAGLVGALDGVARAHARAGGGLGGYVQVQSVPDEEAGGGTGTLACVDADLVASRRPDLVIVCEPTRLGVCTAQVGSRAMRFTVHGVPAHANFKHSGCSATELAMDLAGRLQTSTFGGRQGGEHPLLPPASVNIGRIEGGAGATSVAAECVVETCTTYHPGDESALAGTIDDVVAAWRADHTDEPCSVDVELLHDVMPYETTTSDPLVGLLGRHAAGAAPFAPQGFPAGSDGRLFDQLLQCPTVIFGPGDIEHIHKPDERVDLAEVDRFADIVAAFLLEALRRNTERSA